MLPRHSGEDPEGVRVEELGEEEAAAAHAAVQRDETWLVQNDFELDEEVKERIGDQDFPRQENVRSKETPPKGSKRNQIGILLNAA